MRTWCHLHLAWSEVRWIVGVAPESCFSHALSASVSTAIHLLCPGASPCLVPPRGLLTKATEAAFCSPPLRRKTPPPVAGGFFFLLQKAETEKKGTLDKPSCYCHFLLNKPCSSQLNVQRRFLLLDGRVPIQRPLLD